MCHMVCDCVYWVCHNYGVNLWCALVGDIHDVCKFKLVRLIIMVCT